jgi:hypothetical protein
MMIASGGVANATSSVEAQNSSATAAPMAAGKFQVARKRSGSVAPIMPPYPVHRSAWDRIQRALLGNYIAESFVAGLDGHGGTLVTEQSETPQAPLLTHPHG